MKERCDESLVDLMEDESLTQPTSPVTMCHALPAHDVVMLAFMLLDALTTIHEYAQALHLHMQPSNVLLERKHDEDELVTGHGPRSVRLCEDVLDEGRLPTALAQKVPSANLSLKDQWMVLVCNSHCIRHCIAYENFR